MPTRIIESAEMQRRSPGEQVRLPCLGRPKFFQLRGGVLGCPQNLAGYRSDGVLRSHDE
jgi:hypothetical protein